MNEEQKYLLSSLGLQPYNMSDEQLNLLTNALNKEIEMRQDVRNKELKLDLATKVQNETGKDQHLDDLKADLVFARKTYAKHTSDMDYYKYHGMPVERNADGSIAGASESRLTPIEGDNSQWEITDEDGKVIGYS